MYDVASEIDRQVDFLHQCRAYFPHLSASVAGQSAFPTAPYYRGQGYHCQFQFAAPLSAEFVQGFNDLGHWINQNYVVRLFAVLECHGIVSDTQKIDTRLDGHDCVDILRRLRHRFAHGSGQYDPRDSEKRQLFDRIVEVFRLDEKSVGGRDGKWPIPIDKVLVPLAEGCKKYIQEWGAATDPR